MASDNIIGRVRVKVNPDTDGFRRRVEREIKRALSDLDASIDVTPNFHNKKFNDSVRDTIKLLRRLDRMHVNPEITDRRSDKYTRKIKDDLDNAADSAKRLGDDLDDAMRERNMTQWDRFNRKMDEIANNADRRLGKVGEAMEKSMDEAFEHTDRKLKKLGDDARESFEKIDFTPDVKVDFNRRDVEKRIKEIKDRIATLDRSIKIGVTAGMDEDSLRELKARRDRIQHEIEHLQMHASLDDHDALAKLRRLKHERDGMDQQIRIGVHAEMDKESLEKAEHDYNHLKREMDDLQVAIIPDVNYLARKYAQTTLAWLTRPRRVKIIPDLDNKALRGVASALAALTGARLLNKTIKDLWDGLKNLDKHIPKIGAIALAVTNLSSVLLAASSNTLSLAGSIASIVPAALALPGILGGMAIGITITALAFSDMNKVIPDAVQQWKDLKGTISDNFWAQAAKPIQNLTDVLMPQIVDGFTKASTAVGSFFGKFADAFTDRAAGYLVPMFEDLSKSIHISATYVDEFANIIMTLGEHGAGRLPQLARWFGEISTRFSDFLTKSSESGKLDEWIDRGIFQMKEFGRVIGGASRILYHLSVAAEKAGGSTLTSLADALDRIATAVAKPAFQSGMVRTFKAAHDAMAAISDYAGPALERFLIQLSTILDKVLPSAGRSFGKLMGGVFDALASPTVTSAVTRVFYSLEEAIGGLVPHLPDMADGFAGILDVVGSLLKAAGPLLGSALGSLGSIVATVAPKISEFVDRVMPSVQKLVDKLGPALERIAAEIAEELPEMADAIGRVVDAIIPLIDPLTDLAIDLMPLWTKGMDIIVAGLDTFAVVLEKVTPLVGELSGWFGWLGDFLDGFPLPNAQYWEDFGTTFKQVGVDIATFASGVKEVVAGGFRNAFSWLKGPGKDIVQGLIDGVSGKMSQVWTAFKTGVDLVVQKFKSLLGIQSPSTVFKGFGKDIVQGLINGIQDKISAAKDKIVALKNAISDVFSNAATYLKSKGSQLISGLRAGISERVGAAVERVRNLKTSISNAFSNASSLLVSKGRQVVNGLRDGISNARSSVTSILSTVKSSISNAFFGASSILWNAGYNIMVGLWNGINSMVGSIRAKLNEITSLIPDWKGPAETDKVLLVNAGQLIMQGLIDGFESKFGAVKKSLNSLSDEIGGMEFATPDVEVGMSNTNMARSSYRASQSNTDPAAPTGGGGTNVNANIILPNTDPNAAAFAVAHRLEGLARA